MKTFKTFMSEAKTKVKDNNIKQNDKRRKAVQNVCYDVSKQRWPHPKDAFDKIQDACLKNGLVIVQEDATKWSGMWSAGKPGKENSETFELAVLKDDGKDPNSMHDLIDNCLLAFQWYKGGDEGNWEVNAYLS
jgi:hypothetical protein